MSDGTPQATPEDTTSAEPVEVAPDETQSDSTPEDAAPAEDAAPVNIENAENVEVQAPEAEPAAAEEATDGGV